jgi:hypothetical protein
MRITSTGNVGIGTTAPKTTLEVSGDITIQNNNGSNPTDAGSLYFAEAGLTWGTDFYGFRINQQGSSNYLNFQSANLTTVQDVLTLTRDTARVGIGTTSPAGTLHVVGTSGGAGEIYVSDVDNGAGSSDGLLISKSGTNAFIYNRDNGQISFGTNNVSNNLVITNTGNVGIGTTAPTAELHVETSNQSDVLLKSTSSSSVFTADGFVNSVFAMKENGTLKSEFFYDSINNQMKIRTSSAESLSLGVNNGQNIFIRGSDGNVGIGTTAPSTKLEISDSSYVDLLGLTRNGVNTANLRVGNLGSGDIALDVRLPTTDSRLAVRGAMSVGSGYADSANTGIANGLVVQGNVGIGTNSPGTELHVSAGDAIITAEGSNASYINGAIQLISNHASSLRGLGTFYYIAHTDVEWFAGLPYNNNDAFVINRNTNYTTPSSQTVPPGKGASQGRLLTLDSTGRLGIGTSVPAAELDVNGSIKLSADSSIFSDGSITIGIDYNNNQTDRVFKVVANDTTEVFRVQENGNVGIGTTSPGARLQINGSTSDTTATALAVRNSSLTSLFSIRNDGRVDIPAGALVQSGGGYANTSTSSSYFTGNLGVGTTSPAAKLEIVHTDAGKDTLVLGRTDNSSYWKVNHAGNDFRLYNRDSSGADILFGVDAGSITQNNRVGIGTATPSAKLDVAGDVATTGNITVTKSSASIKVIETGGGDVRMTAGGATGYIGTYNNNSLQLVQNGSVALFVDTSRRVGIGTTSPTTALQVVGRTKTSELHASNGNAIYTNQGSVAVGTSQVDSSAVLNIVSTTKGVLFPRMTETQRDAIEEPTTGLIVYQTDGTEGLYIYKSTGWTQII